MDTLFDVLNGIRFALCLSLVAVFGRYIWSNFGLVWKIRIRMDRVQAAIAFFVYEVGESGWRGFIWWNHGDARTAFTTHGYIFFMISGLVAAVGSICCLRVLLPDQWRWPTWLMIAALVSIIVLSSLPGSW
jgi:hypothetical protein